MVGLVFRVTGTAMMTSDRTDVIVAGAGPGGSTAAKLLADGGYSVLLIDRSNFPRHKTCASWINRLAFERFSYLKHSFSDLVENPFFGVAFYDRSIEREARYHERRPSGYLSLRSKFDDGLRRIAMEAGARFMGGCAVADLVEEQNGIRVRLEDGREMAGRILIGADGASSRVAVRTGLRKGWSPGDYALCANTDVPFPPERISAFYGGCFPFRVYLEYEGIQGYGWVFPKRQHVCIGIGALLKDGRSIRQLFREFVQALRHQNHIPDDLPEAKVYFDLDPVGGVYRIPSLVRGRVMLVGDAAGFVSGSTGEGIYPAMVSAEVAVGVIHQALKGSSPASVLERYNKKWCAELGDYVKRLPGGARESETRGRLDMIFRFPLVPRIAGRAFLYGEKPSIATLLRSF
ncbi:MAG TPA: NAD(P)/FAD-dependent oxidoreductase [Terriglobia bacterium]|nr:NAD(P)/FAD-dependent oxidoreductase [Terriglobia bacterium]